MSQYVRPQDINAPRKHWQLRGVLHDGGAGRYSVAYGTWNGEPVLAVRWNGGDGEPAAGFPRLSTHAAWFVIPKVFYGGVLLHLLLDRRIARDQVDAVALEQAIDQLLMTEWPRLKPLQRPLIRLITRFN